MKAEVLETMREIFPPTDPMRSLDVRVMLSHGEISFIVVSDLVSKYWAQVQFNKSRKNEWKEIIGDHIQELGGWKDT
jgi:hypothetical protein